MIYLRPPLDQKTHNIPPQDWPAIPPTTRPSVTNPDNVSLHFFPFSPMICCETLVFVGVVLCSTVFQGTMPKWIAKKILMVTTPGPGLTYPAPLVWYHPPNNHYCRIPGERTKIKSESAGRASQPKTETSAKKQVPHNRTGVQGGIPRWAPGDQAKNLIISRLNFIQPRNNPVTGWQPNRRELRKRPPGLRQQADQ